MSSDLCSHHGDFLNQKPITKYILVYNLSIQFTCISHLKGFFYTLIE